MLVVKRVWTIGFVVFVVVDVFVKSAEVMQNSTARKTNLDFEVGKTEFRVQKGTTKRFERRVSHNASHVSCILSMLKIIRVQIWETSYTKF